MNLAETIQDCISTRGWTASKLANESGVPVPCITRVLTGEREGMHSKNLTKLLPFLYPGQAPACERTASCAPGTEAE